MTKENTLQYILLGLLAKQDLTGYDIKKLFEQEVGDFWFARHSQVYPELRKMEKKRNDHRPSLCLRGKTAENLLPPGSCRPPETSGMAGPASGYHDAHPG